MDGDGLFNVGKEHMLIEPAKFYTLGSGEEKFLEIHKEIEKTHPDPGVARTFTEMLRREEHPEVGGYCQIGIADKSGFNLVPTIETKRPNRGKVKFLGFDVSSLDCIEDFVVGHRAIGLDT